MKTLTEKGVAQDFSEGELKDIYADIFLKNDPHALKTLSLSEDKIQELRQKFDLAPSDRLEKNADGTYTITYTQVDSSDINAYVDELDLPKK